MQIGAHFDSGNIEVLDATDPGAVRLAIRTDSNAEFYQWFHFRASGVRDVDCQLHIVNARDASYPIGWEDYRAVASYDRETWFRVPTDYTDGIFTIRHRPEFDAVYYAYFAPYSLERHRDFIARCQVSPLVRHEVLGHSVDGEDMDLLVVGEAGADKRLCWVLARQHPGETQGQFWMEGFLGRLLDTSDAVAKRILKGAAVHAVPNMNPDGGRRGNLRANAAGVNLNRAWTEPSMETCPEVYLVRQRMLATGVDFCLDVHATEERPYVHVISSDRVPSLPDRVLEVRETFDNALADAHPDWSTEYGFPRNASRDTINMDLCSAWVADTFGCLALTVEMPFKDNAKAPDATFGWSPERARRLGAASVQALGVVFDDLR